jgi:hypothetical protein
MSLRPVQICVRTDDLEGGYYPVAGADVFLMNASARTNADGYATIILSDLPTYGANMSIHRIGYKPQFVFFKDYNVPDRYTEVYTTYEVASVNRVQEVFTDFSPYLPGTGCTVNWDNMVNRVPDYPDYTLIDPQLRYYDAGYDCNNLLSDFCSKNNGTYRETAPSSGSVSNPTLSWECRDVTSRIDLTYLGYFPESTSSGYSGTVVADIGQFRAPSNDFIIGLPAFLNMYDYASAWDIGYKYSVSSVSGVYVETNSGGLNFEPDGIYSGMCELRVTGMTPNELAKVYLGHYAFGARHAGTVPSQTLPYSVMVISTHLLYLHNTPTDYWCCYNEQFSTDGFNHYNGPFGPVYH